ncbi:phosphoribosyltransferase [Secundilactobacillus paracollinoides]|jgi:hypothetical protein|uniref:phosphoribosyltransferase n=1 Tax=Secundilactobacillus paracollinoides TaxID=240427 RepID=UPI00081A73D8|nr:phosphoribosyltransferase [Secundilactobacillus paracollinoides]ANZ62573.1 hypothetical protein AYR61_14470 [Secundilactobacillus paracollinoides]
MTNIFYSKDFFLSNIDVNSAKDFISYAASNKINLILISHSDINSNSDIIKFLGPLVPEKDMHGFQFLTREKSKISDFIKNNPGKNIFIGNKEEDLFKASSLKCLYLCPMWTDNIDEKSKKYGIHIKDLKHLIQVIQILINQNAFYYELKINNVSTVYALTSANNISATEDENSVINAFRSTLKNGNSKYLDAITLYLLSGIMSLPEIMETEIWGIMPSSGTNINEEMSQILTQCRYLTDRRLKEPLLIRHTPTQKSHWTEPSTRLSVGALKHLKSIKINPKYRGKITGKKITILDDYITNGCSFEAVRNLLISAGASEVNFIAIGRFKSRKYNGLGIYQKEEYSLTGDLFSDNYTSSLSKRESDYGLHGKYNVDARQDVENLKDILEL